MRFSDAVANRCSTSAALCAVRACVSAFSAATALARASPVCSVTSWASSVINTSPARTRSPALTRMPAIVATIRLEMDADSRAATTPPASSRSAVSIAATGATVTGIGSPAFACGPVLAPAAGGQTTRHNTERDDSNQSIHDHHVLGSEDILPRAARARARAPRSGESRPFRRSWPATLPPAPLRRLAARRSLWRARSRTDRG